MYARSLEEYRSALEGLAKGSVDPSKPDIRFSIAHVILTADSGNAEGIEELKGAVQDGFSDVEKMQELLDDERVRAADKDEIRLLLADVKRAAEAAAKAAEEGKDADVSNEDDASETDDEETE
jgi:hypothetical protein